jgi:hypothetical protein
VEIIYARYYELSYYLAADYLNQIDFEKLVKVLQEKLNKIFADSCRSCGDIQLKKSWGSSLRLDLNIVAHPNIRAKNVGKL